MATATTAFAPSLRATGLRLERIRQSWLYDALMRLPILAWAAVLVLASSIRLREYVDTADPTLSVLTFGVNIAMRAATLSFFALIVWTVVLRLQPKARARGIEPRVSALFGTFLASAMVFFPRCDLSVGLEIVSILFIAIGNLLATVALIQLGRSFSIMPEARKVVTSGLYGLVRHPLYLAEQLATMGILIQFLSQWTLLLCIVQMAFQLRRMHNEESVLTENSPEYRAYCGRTSRLLPGIY